MASSPSGAFAESLVRADPAEGKVQTAGKAPIPTEPRISPAAPPRPMDSSRFAHLLRCRCSLRIAFQWPVGQFARAHFTASASSS